MTGVARDCQHGGRHTHGTRMAYTEDRCRCDPCRAAASEYRTRQRRARLTVPAGPTYAHIARLYAAGMSKTEIETASGTYLPNARPKRVRTVTQTAILAITPRPGNKVIPAAGTLRRFRALATLGWPTTTTAAVAGVAMSTYHNAARTGTVRASTAVAVHDAYARLWDTASPTPRATATAAAARARHWPPPAAYDDATIDDPDPAVDEAAKAATPTPRQLRAAARRTGPGGPIDMADLEHLTRYGHDVTSVADRLGVTVGAIRVACHRNGRADILARLEAQSPTAETCPTCGVVFGNHQTLAAHEGRHHRKTA